MARSMGALVFRDTEMQIRKHMLKSRLASQHPSGRTGHILMIMMSPFALSILCYTPRQRKQTHNPDLLPNEVSDVQGSYILEPSLMYTGNFINIYEKCIINSILECNISNPLLTMLLLHVCLIKMVG